MYRNIMLDMGLIINEIFITENLFMKSDFICIGKIIWLPCRSQKKYNLLESWREILKNCPVAVLLGGAVAPV